MRVFILVLFLFILITSCEGDICNEFMCGKYGKCVFINQTPRCKCDLGYIDDGLNCVKVSDDFDLTDLIPDLHCKANGVWDNCIDETNNISEDIE